ncbi:MAG: UPF0182 family protein [Acidobacteriota bacterium]
MQRWTLLLLGVAAAVWLALAGGIALYVDFLWFGSIGYLPVFEKTLWSKFFYWVLGFAVAFSVLGCNLWLASRRSKGTFWVRHELIQMAQKGSDYLFWIAILILSIFTGLITQSQWMAFLQYQHRVEAGVTDPIFGRDVSFYFFSLPILSFLASLALIVLFFAFLIAAASYIVHGHVGYNGRLQLSKPARIHLSVVLGIGFLFLAYSFWLKRFGILYSREGRVFGAGYSDVNAWLPCYTILAVLALLTGFLFFLSSLTRSLRLVAFAGIGFGVAFLGTQVYPALVQTFIVRPNELKKEIPYIAHNIRMTSQAYRLDQVEVREFKGEGELTVESLRRNQATLRNIRLWDWRPIKDAYGQLQSIRPYYDFHDVDVDRYVIDGLYRQVVLSARELDASRISDQAQSWISQHFQYTHGYGVCLSPVNEVTSEGLPEFFIKDIPPRSSVDITIERPEIYFGEESRHPVFVRTRMEEFDYPVGDQNAHATYREERGLAINSFLRRLLFAWELKAYAILFTRNFTAESRVLIHRGIQDRIPKIAPFLHYDSDPYLVIHEGRLVWIQDAYTTSDRYPYSEPYQQSFNYIRNAVKVVVDAYLGDTTFYISDAEDPLIQVYSRIFPGMFKPLDEMPAGLRSHIRYPEDLFDIQSQMFRTYHMRDTTVFYNNEDFWEIASEIYSGNQRTMESYYVILKLPDASREEFVLLIPFTPKNKNNMIGWLAARSDGDHYGRLILYQFPKQQLTYGPMQIEARIDQDPEISQLITLWSQKGSQVIRGNLLVIPIEDSLLYVEPLYLQAEKSQIPELTRVLSVYRNRVAIGETLEESLASVLKTDGRTRARELLAPRPDLSIRGQTLGGLVEQALRHFDNARGYLKEGKWAAYGEEQDKLGQVLRELARGRNQTESRKPRPD